MTLQERHEAEKEVFRQVQSDSFDKERTIVAKGGTLPKSNPLSRLSPKVVDNLLRVGGRLGRAPLSFDERHPIILPSSSHITHLLILEAHAKLLHASVAQVVEQLRRRFYIPNLRRTVRSLLNKCIECRRFHARPGEQQMSELPLSRVDTSTSPFYVAGSDLFGPISVKVGRGRARHKRWVPWDGVFTP